MQYVATCGSVDELRTAPEPAGTLLLRAVLPMTEPRAQFLVRVPADLLRKLDRWTKQSQKKMGPSWSRNDQVVWILRNYTAPEEK